MSQLRTFGVYDPNGAAGMTPAEEMRTDVEHLELMLGITLDVVGLGANMRGVPEGIDILLFDYGGMEGYGKSRMGEQSRLVMQWAQDHPSAAVLVESNFTWEQSISRELAASGLSLPNVLPVHSWTRSSSEDMQKIREWFGIVDPVATVR